MDGRSTVSKCIDVTDSPAAARHFARTTGLGMRDRPSAPGSRVEGRRRALDPVLVSWPLGLGLLLALLQLLTHANVQQMVIHTRRTHESRREGCTATNTTPHEWTECVAMCASARATDSLSEHPFATMPEAALCSPRPARGRPLQFTVAPGDASPTLG